MILDLHTLSQLLITMEGKTANNGEVAMISSVDNFYAEKTVDYTFTNSSDHQISPTTAITDTKINFTIGPLANPNVFYLNEALLRLKLQIVDKTGALPEAGRDIAPVNLFTSAMFRQCRIFLNEIEIR